MEIYPYYPLSFLPIYPYTQPITFNPEYINDLIALGVTDYFSPTQFVTNPLFAHVDSFNQNIGILQTATNSLTQILTLIDTLKNINNPTEDILQTFEDEINKILQNTTFNDTPVFNQTINLNGISIDLNIPLFNPDEISIDDYEKLIKDKLTTITSTLQNVTFTLPFENTTTNPIDFNTFETLLNSGTLLSAYNTNLITPTILELLLQ